MEHKSTLGIDSPSHVAYTTGTRDPSEMSDEEIENEITALEQEYGRNRLSLAVDADDDAVSDRMDELMDAQPTRGLNWTRIGVHIVLTILTGGLWICFYGGYSAVRAVSQ